MTTARAPILAPVCLVLGALLGMAGTFVQSPTLRGLAWGVDGVALVIAGALLVVHHLRQGQDVVAAGFIVFTVGQGSRGSMVFVKRLTRAVDAAG
jgi:hypothetical protein